jgi:pyruvate,water dikinase
MLETAHWGGTMTPMLRHIAMPALMEGFRKAGARYGFLLDTLEVAFVHDHAYIRPRPLGGRTPKKAPPKAAMWVASRVVPALRKRGAAARKTLATKGWNEHVRWWRDEERPALVAALQAVQAEDPAALDDAALADHLERAASVVVRGVDDHFTVGGSYIVAGGRLVAAGERWRIPAEDMLRLLIGSTPASIEASTHLEPLGRLLAQRGTTPSSLDDLRALDGPALDGYLDWFGHRAVARYDIDSPTLIEQPDLVLASIVAMSQGRGTAAAEADPAAVRDRVPAAEREHFDELVAEARATYGVRDDNAGIALQWTIGLLRRAVLEAGRRAVTAGRLDDEAHVMDLTPREATGILRGKAEPSAKEAASRHARRMANLAEPAPTSLGSEPEPPSLDALPAPLREVNEAAFACFRLVFTREGERSGFTGSGIGSTPYRGTARIVREVGDAFTTLHPGDGLIASYTTPAYNAVLMIAGAVVIEEGGLLSHGAVVARELGLPAVVGVKGATEIPDGASVEVDPVAGVVKVLSG